MDKDTGTGSPHPSRQALLVVGDIFFSARLRDTLKHLGIGAASARTMDDVAAELAAAGSPPALVLVELGIRSLDASALIRKLKAEGPTRAVPILAFAGHLEGERLDGASQAGADLVVTNGQISADLPGLLRTLGVAGAPA